VEEALLGGGEGLRLIAGGGGEPGRQHSIWIIYYIRNFFRNPGDSTASG
jgi:hypothetical protein